MAKMVKCKSCGTEVASNAKACPQCGRDPRNFFVKHKIISVILAIAIISIIASLAGGGDKTSDTSDSDSTNNTTTTSNATDANDTSTETSNDEVEETPVEVITISAVDLAKAYIDNEVSADKEYKDKTVLTTGEIKDIGVIFNQTFILLSSGDDFSLTDVQCFFKEEDEIDKIADLAIGDEVTVQGIVDGKSMNVSVQKCTFK